MTISLCLNDEDTRLFKEYAQVNGITLSELVRQSVLERIESEYDLELYKKAVAEYQENPVTYSLDEVERKLKLK